MVSLDPHYHITIQAARSEDWQIENRTTPGIRRFSYGPNRSIDCRTGRPVARWMTWQRPPAGRRLVVNRWTRFDPGRIFSLQSKEAGKKKSTTSTPRAMKG